MTTQDGVAWRRKPLRHLTATELNELLEHLAGSEKATDVPLVNAVRRELSRRKAIRPDRDASWLIDVV